MKEASLAYDNTAKTASPKVMSTAEILGLVALLPAFTAAFVALFNALRYFASSRNMRKGTRLAVDVSGPLSHLLPIKGTEEQRVYLRRMFRASLFLIVYVAVLASVLTVFFGVSLDGKPSV